VTQVGQRLERRLPAGLRPLDVRQSWPRTLLRWALAAFIGTAGVGHFTNAEEFLAQVPPYLPAPELLVTISGVVEIALAVALVVLPRWRRAVGFATLLFLLAVLPGNIAQYTEARDAFGLNSDAARLTRVLLSPLLWVWATAAGDLWPRPRRRRSSRRIGPRG
jgi:uncharacterized membrane protein